MKGSLGSLIRYEFSSVNHQAIVYYSLAVTQYLYVSVVQGVDYGNNFRILLQSRLLRLRHKRPKLVNVDDCSPGEVASYVEVAHTNLTEVTRMVLIEVGSLFIEGKGVEVRIHVFQTSAITKATHRWWC